MNDALDNLQGALAQLWASVYEWATTPVLWGIPWWELFLAVEAFAFFVIVILMFMGLLV